MQTDDEFIRQISGDLNDQQKAAVTTTHGGPVLVLAGAGCGKTSVLTRRIAFCARFYCEQHRVLALTFTRKAAMEMADRIVNLSGLDREKAQPVITTFHGFALRVLKESVLGRRNFARLGYRSDPVLMTGEQRYRLLAASSTWEERRSLDADLARLDALLAQKAVHPQKLARLTGEQRRTVDEIARRITAGKKEQGLWDFSDFINEASLLFGEFPEVRLHYAGFFKAMLVDEFQDTNPLQVSFLNQLGAAGNRLFAVGDDDQAIYGFRGADIEPIVSFDRLFQGARIYKLETNYRSTPPILRSANRIFAGKEQRLRKLLRSGRFGPRDGRARPWPAPQKLRLATQERTAGWIMTKAKALAAAERIAPRDMAVLFRVNQSLDWMRACLQSIAPDGEALPQLLTVHGSKGLEFPAVFLCDLEEETFPAYRRTRAGTWRSAGDLAAWFFTGRRPLPADCDIGEEKRLFYVAVTRAEKHLFLISTEWKEHYGRIRRYEPSRFLRMI